jgi:zinc/manganese transport system substrate-binding protein
MKSIFCVLALCLALPAHAALNIFACTPEWAALAKELAGEQASLYAATTALQDAHRIEARPSLIARARRAQLVICTGAELESGWLPLVQAQSGNAAIQAGQPGYFEAASAVTLIEKPAKLDRSLGDVHAAGNPHLHLDPRNIAAVASALAQRMAALDPADADGYRKRAAAFEGRWRDAMARWERRAQPLQGMAVVVHHRDLSYLLRWLGMREAGALEPRPGLPPSTASLSELLETLKKAPASAVVRSAYADPRPSEWLAERTGMPAVVLPFTVGGTPGAKDLFGLFDDTLDRLLAARRPVSR